MTDRHRHHRQRDHFGSDSDLYVGIDGPIGPWEQYTPVKYVLEDLYSKMATLASSNRHVATFAVNAYVLAPGSTVGSVPGNIRSIFTVKATVKKAGAGSFIIYAIVIKGGNFTINAWVRGHGTLTINAFVV